MAVTQQGPGNGAFDRASGLTTGNTLRVCFADDSAITVGTVVVTEASIGPTGAATPVQATFIGGTDGTNLRGISVDSTGKVNINAISGAISLPTGASTSALQTTGNTSLSSIDGKITAVNTGAVVVSSSALPTGASTAAKQPALGTVTTPSTDVITTQFSDQTAVSGSLTVVDSGSSTTTGQNSQSIVTGTATAGSAVSATLNGRASVQVMLSGTWVGTLSFEKSNDSGTTWTPYGLHVVGTAFNATAPTGNGLFHGDVIGSTTFRVRWTTRTSGTVSVTVVASSQIADIYTHGTIKVGDSTTSSQIASVSATGQFSAIASGDVASAATDSGNPVKIGAVGHTALPTAVTDGQRVNLTADKLGQLVTVHSLRDTRSNQQTTITASTAETTIITSVASTFLDLYGLILTNTSSTSCKVTIKDATAGTTRFVFQVPATETRGFMLPGCDGHKQAAVNNNWTATCATSVSSIEVTALFKQTT